MSRPCQRTIIFLRSERRAPRDASRAALSSSNCCVEASLSRGVRQGRDKFMQWLMDREITLKANSLELFRSRNTRQTKYEFFPTKREGPAKADPFFAVCLASEGQMQLVLNRPLGALIERTDTAYRALGALRSEVVDASDAAEAGCTAVDCPTGGGGVLQHACVVCEVGEFTRVVERDYWLQSHSFRQPLYQPIHLCHIRNLCINLTIGRIEDAVGLGKLGDGLNRCSHLDELCLGYQAASRNSLAGRRKSVGHTVVVVGDES